MHSSVFRSLEQARKRELEDGFPLIVLGTTVVQDDTLASHEIKVVP
nr:hypothetical protein [Rhodococcus wratislaviensis]